MSKITRTYETEDTISIWTYDLDKFKNGPISVETIDKKPQPVKKKKINNPLIKGDYFN